MDYMLYLSIPAVLDWLRLPFSIFDLFPYSLISSINYLHCLSFFWCSLLGSNEPSIIIFPGLEITNTFPLFTCFRFCVCILWRHPSSSCFILFSLCALLGASLTSFFFFLAQIYIITFPLFLKILFLYSLTSTINPLLYLTLLHVVNPFGGHQSAIYHSFSWLYY